MVESKKLENQPFLHCGMENLEILISGKVKPVMLWSNVMTLNFVIGVFITLVPIFGRVMILGNVQCSKL